MKFSSLLGIGLAAVGVAAHPSNPLHAVRHSHLHIRQSNTTSNSTTVQSTILVFAIDAPSAQQATSGLNAYGIPFQVVLVPQAGITLPVLNSSLTSGNYGGIIVASGVPYDYGASGWASALTSAQWQTLYNYQLAFGVRMVQYDVYPEPQFGTTVVGSCCNAGVEHLFQFTNTTAFTQAGLNSYQGITTQGLFHYVASITDPTTTTEVAQFAQNSQFTTNTTAAVINNFAGREQMVFFISWATDWSQTSSLLQHAYINWMTRGLYSGYRRVNLNTQVDDMFLWTNTYDSELNFRLNTSDLNVIKAWVPTIQAKMNPGSYYRPEIGHNGNGNIIWAVENTTRGATACGQDPVWTSDTPDTPLEYQKPLGSGSNAWPPTPTSYPYPTGCVKLDPLQTWWATTANRDTFMHITHTFTHENEDNATYSDVYKEISFNQKWLAQVGIAAGNFTSNGLIPPAITGLHNGDALQAWHDCGLTNAVGDNSRPVLLNTQNDMWPYITTMAANGYAGFTVLPRWSLRIYYNCDTPDCTLQEWIDTSNGTASGNFSNLMLEEKQDTMRKLFGLHHEAYMFHQENLRATGVAPITTPYGTQVTALIQAWVEQTVYEFTRLVNWPMQTLKQSDLYTAFTNRMARDQCGYNLSWTVAGGKITGITVTANGNTCSAKVPVTVPGSVTNLQGFTTEKIGNDPLTIWVQLSGNPVSFTLSTPVSVL